MDPGGVRCLCGGPAGVLGHGRAPGDLAQAPGRAQALHHVQAGDWQHTDQAGLSRDDLVDRLCPHGRGEEWELCALRRGQRPGGPGRESGRDQGGQQGRGGPGVPVLRRLDWLLDLPLCLGLQGQDQARQAQLRRLQHPPGGCFGGRERGLRRALAAPPHGTCVNHLFLLFLLKFTLPPSHLPTCRSSWAT